MIRSNIRLKALGLSAMVLGLMAFSAGSAQAETGANWMLNGSNVTAGLLPSIDITNLDGGSVLLATKIAGASVIYECTAAKLIGAKLETEGKITNGFKVKFTGCETFLNLTLSALCVPKSAGQANGTVETLALKGLMQLHSSEPVVKIEPKEGANLAVFTHEEECSLPENVPLRGYLVLKDSKTEGDIELVAHLIAEHKLTYMYVLSDTPEHAAIMAGSANVVLTGAHAGLKWSGLPG